MQKLEVLDLEGNKVDDLGALVYLGWCPQLAVLTLADNPVAQEPTYNAQVVSTASYGLCIFGCMYVVSVLIHIQNKWRGSLAF